MATPVDARYPIGGPRPLVGGSFRGGKFAGTLPLGELMAGGALSVNDSSLSGAAVSLANVAPAGSLASASYPAWRQGLAPMQPAGIPGTVFWDSPDFATWTAPGGGRAGLFAYSGGALDTSRSRMWRFGGGHNDYAGNDPWMLDLQADAPVWRQQRAPTAAVTQDVPFYSDGRPSSFHTYWGAQYHQARDLFVLVQGSSVWGGGGVGPGSLNAFDPHTGDWVPTGTLDGGMTSGSVWKDRDENFWSHQDGTGALRKWDNATNSASLIRTGNAPVYETAYGYDPVRNIAVRFYNTGAATGYLNLSAGNAPFVATPVTGPAAAAFEPGDGSINRYSITYDNHQDCFWVIKRWDGGTLYRVTVQGAGPYTLRAEAFSLTPAVADWYSSGGDGASTYGAFAYAPNLRGIVWSYWLYTQTVFIPTA